ncbi:MAG: hypothetical protein GY856_28510 [bacterium]|nr:hypothetical protein [bacterium]
MIMIEIENPMEVAEKESLFARTFGRMAPDFIRRKVDERVAQDIEASLLARGIKVAITVR